jgi:hypothetical protein
MVGFGQGSLPARRRNSRRIACGDAADLAYPDNRLGELWRRGAARAMPVDTCLLTEDGRQLMATWEVVVMRPEPRPLVAIVRAAGSVSEPLRS